MRTFSLPVYIRVLYISSEFSTEDYVNLPYIYHRRQLLLPFVPPNSHEVYHADMPLLISKEYLRLYAAYL